MGQRALIGGPLLLLGLLLSCQGDPGPAGVSHLPNDITPPEVVIILPKANARVGEEARVEIRASDDTGLSTIHFRVDGELQSHRFDPLASGRLYRWDLSGLAWGEHWLEVSAFDTRGKQGQSTPLRIFKVPPDSLPTRDTLFYFSDEHFLVEFRYPPDSSQVVTGWGVRFTPQMPCRVRSLAIKVKRKEAWSGYPLYLDLYTLSDNRPDSLLTRKVVILRPSIESGDYTSWEAKSLGSPGIPIESEFFVGVMLPEGAQGDSITLFTDRGLWNSDHTLVYHRDGYWTTPAQLRLPPLNPLIYAVVDY